MTFRNFRTQFRENCGATYQQKLELCSATDRTIHSEKKPAVNCVKIDHKPSHNTCLNNVPHTQADQA